MSHVSRRFSFGLQALFQRHGLVRPPVNDWDAIGGDRRLYAAALEVVVGSHCHVRCGGSLRAFKMIDYYEEVPARAAN